MKKIASTVIIYKRGASYYCDATGCFGGGYTGAFAGNTAEAAGLFALREKGRYIDSNPFGGTLSAPAEVREAITQTRVSP